MRSWAPFCSGCPGTIRSTLMPSRIHQSESRESRARPGEPKGLPSNGKGGSGGGSGTFDLLGFTHHWKRSYRSRAWVIQRKTATSRLNRAIRKVSEWCRENRHLKVAEQFKALASKLRGHYQYFGLTGNRRALSQFFDAVRRE